MSIEYKTLTYKKKEEQRNYGIDLLRFFQMVNIINLHINSKTGLLYINSNKFKEIWRLETFSYCAVDCFGLISGIVGFDKYLINYIYI
jgi:surface polysaccharide O-acyltransferase-like enzyme